MKAYYNGKFGDLGEISVPLTDRSIFFGDGVYDVTYSRNYHIYALEEHVDRFFHSAELLKIKINVTKEELCELLKELVNKMENDSSFPESYEEFIKVLKM